MPKELNEDTLGGRIRSARKEKGFTLQELANRVGSSHQSIQAAETNVTVPRGPLLRAIAKELDVSMDWLVTGQGSRDAVEAVADSDQELAEAVAAGLRDDYRKQLMVAIARLSDDQVVALAQLCQYFLRTPMPEPEPEPEPDMVPADEVMSMVKRYMAEIDDLKSQLRRAQHPGEYGARKPARQNARRKPTLTEADILRMIAEEEKSPEG